MAKVADVKLGWTRSPSSDVVKQVVIVNIDGNATTFETTPDVESWMIEVGARGSFNFHVDSYDDEGNVTSSETYTAVLGDLEAPVAASGLFHTVVGVREVPPVTPPEPPPAQARK